MLKILVKNKLIFIVITTIVILYSWAQIGGFRLLKDDSGTEWSPQGNQGLIHHK
jgi:hypothetical protein